VGDECKFQGLFLTVSDSGGVRSGDMKKSKRKQGLSKCDEQILSEVISQGKNAQRPEAGEKGAIFPAGG